MKKSYLFFFFPLFFASCGYDVANNTRMTFTGRITDEAGNPLSGVSLYLEGVDNVGGFYIGASSSEESEILGLGATAPSGEFQIISLKSTHNNLYINPSENSYLFYLENIGQNHTGIQDSLFSSVVYVNVPGSLDLGTIQLRRRADFHIKINKTSTSNDTLFWRISYTHPICRYVYENGQILEEESSCYEIIADRGFQEQTPEEPNFEKNYRTIVGGIAKFTYHINGEAEQTMVWNIDQTHVTHVFEY